MSMTSVLMYQDRMAPYGDHACFLLVVLQRCQWLDYIEKKGGMNWKGYGRRGHGIFQLLCLASPRWISLKNRFRIIGEGAIHIQALANSADHRFPGRDSKRALSEYESYKNLYSFIISIMRATGTSCLTFLIWFNSI
jgi:hypothetical protein